MLGGEFKTCGLWWMEVGGGRYSGRRADGKRWRGVCSLKPRGCGALAGGDVREVGSSGERERERKECARADEGER